jgi:hypothetical protein
MGFRLQYCSLVSAACKWWIVDTSSEEHTYPEKRLTSYSAWCFHTCLFDVSDRRTSLCVSQTYSPMCTPSSCAASPWPRVRITCEIAHVRVDRSRHQLGLLCAFAPREAEHQKFETIRRYVSHTGGMGAQSRPRNAEHSGSHRQISVRRLGMTSRAEHTPPRTNRTAPMLRPGHRVPWRRRASNRQLQDVV